jgi:HK97 family phage major capsid protein
MYAQLLRNRAELQAHLESLVNGPEMDEAGTRRFDAAMEKLKGVQADIEAHNQNFGVKLREPGMPNAPRAADPELSKRLLGRLADFYRGEITASDDALIIGSGGLSGTIPTSIMDRLSTYFQADPFQQAGATILQTISAGAAPDAFSEGQSSTDSHPMAVDTSLVFGGTKYSRLVKCSEEALLNSSLNLPGEITAELAAAVANGFTAVNTTALITALHSNSATLVDAGSNDPYHSVLALINAVPPRFDDGTACFMGSRAMKLIISDARAEGTGAPLLNPVDNTILGKRFVVNDSLTRLVYGNWRAGAYVRKSPYFLQILLEAYAATGERGFKATQWVDSKFVASVSGVSVQPLYYTHLDTAGS